jgi:transcriptional regulator
MMRQIVPCRMQITGIDGTWKLSQNKPDAVRERAAKKMTTNGFGNEVGMLSAQMLGVSKG